MTKFWENKHQNCNNHIVICTPASNFIEFVELQILGPNLPQKYEWKEFWKNKH